MHVPVIALGTNRIVNQAPGLQHVRVHVESFELRSGPRAEPDAAGARGRVVGLVRDVRDVAEESHGLDCKVKRVVSSRLSLDGAEDKHLLRLAGVVVELKPVPVSSVHPVEPPSWPPRMLPVTWAPYFQALSKYMIANDLGKKKSLC